MYQKQKEWAKSSVRPKSSVTKRTIDLYAEAFPHHKKNRNGYDPSRITDNSKNHEKNHKQGLK